MQKGAEWYPFLSGGGTGRGGLGGVPQGCPPQKHVPAFPKNNKHPCAEIKRGGYTHLYENHAHVQSIRRMHAPLLNHVCGNKIGRLHAPAICTPMQDHRAAWFRG